jgi:hypothetical protein
VYRNAIEYKGTWLAPGSRAHQLHTEKKFKELDQHMKEVDERDRQLLERSNNE